jgi:hypothetical protein
MGKQLSFTEENVKKNPYDYPKLKLAKGESARLTVVENPYSEWVHNIQKPQLDEAGNLLYKTMTRKDDTEYQTPRLSFVSNPICLGKDEALDADGIDPENCPVCARAAAGGKGFFPKRRFAMHVIRTVTAPNSNKAQDPYAGSLIIWAFTDNVFSEIFRLNNEHGLDEHDLILGPCEDATFQKAKLSIAKDTAPTEEQKKAIFAEKNRSEDPTVFCGNRKSEARILDDLKVVDDTWALVKGDGEAEPTASLNDGISALLDDTKDEQGWSKTGPDEPKPAPAAAASEPTPVGSFDELPDTPAAAPEKPKVASKPTTNIDDILDGL